MPTFYSDVTIIGQVTLDVDASIDSLTINAGKLDNLTTNSNTDLSIGAGVSLGILTTLTVDGEAFVGGANNAGAIAVNDLLDIRSAVTGAGSLNLGAGAELELGATDAETVNFDGAGATLKLDQSTGFSGTLSGLVANDVIDIADQTVTSAGVNAAGTELTIAGATSTLIYALSNFESGSIRWPAKTSTSPSPTPPEAPAPRKAMTAEAPAPRA